MKFDRRSFIRIASIGVGAMKSTLWIMNTNAEAQGNPCADSSLPYSFPYNDPQTRDAICVYPFQSETPMARKCARGMGDSDQAQFVKAVGLLAGEGFESQPWKSKPWQDLSSVHAYMCSCAGILFPNLPDSHQALPNVHQDGRFLLWHRAYLFVLEKMLRAQAPDLDSLRLNYWDWENAAGQTSVPDLYAKGPLLPDKRGTFRPAPAKLCLTPTFMNSDFRLFMGIPDPKILPPVVASPVAMNGPHSEIHNAFQNGIMNDITQAAQDPVFFAHHCNVDRMFESWMTKFGCPKEKLQPGDIPDAIWVHDSKQWWKLPCDNLWDTRALGYYYDNLMSTGAMPTSEQQLTFDPKSEKLVPTPSAGTASKAPIAKSMIAVNAAKSQKSESARTEYLILQNVKIPADFMAKASDFRLFAKHVRAGQRTTPSNFVAELQTLPMGHMMASDNVISTAVETRINLSSLVRKKGKLKLFLAPVDRKGNVLLKSKPLVTGAARLIQVATSGSA